jgi:UDP-N-acetylglucosamine 1-carboxyvinyltransferase
VENEVFKVTGGSRLSGQVHVPGAKNSALKLMTASLLAAGTTQLENVPDIADVEIMAELLTRLGAQVNRDISNSTLEIKVPENIGHRADYDLVRRMRASINVLGPILARCHEVDVALPGGDEIGSRGVDMHIAGLTKMGAEFNSDHGYLIARAPKGLHGARIWLDIPSVGATENILTAAVLAKGETVIENAAREPEIVDLCLMLNKMGAQVSGIGTNTISIIGVTKLTATTHEVVGDRIVAGTWAVAAAITQGEVTVTGVNPTHLQIPLEKLMSAGAQIEIANDSFTVRMTQRPNPVEIVTLPYPGFPTDLQPQFIVLNSIANGAAMVTENLFEARFRFTQELARLGADLQIDGHHCLVKGRLQLSAAPVEATDVRAGAALVLAGLIADGVTVVSGVSHIDRGYANFVSNLTSLGATIERTRESI